MDLIIGAGISGLAYANFCGHEDFLVIEKDSEIGGYCKTIKQDGFVWDYSGHFFHFKDQEIKNYLISRMDAQEILEVTKSSKIKYKNQLIDFPFQKNIHQLEKVEFIECLYDLYFKDEKKYKTFKQMLYSKFGKGISEKFLIPYNEKLYACDMDTLDSDAMGRFFPYADFTDIIRNFKESDNNSYNSTFIYPRGGAIEFVKALYNEIDKNRVCLNEKIIKIDLKEKVGTTSKRKIKFNRVISSIPFINLLNAVDCEYDKELYSYNKVLVFNLGFDKKGDNVNHWIYFPEKKYCFYRIGFYDNIFNSERMSLYVELGFSKDENIDAGFWFSQVLLDLKKANIITNHNLISHHSIVMNPAYVHINERCREDVSIKKEHLKVSDIYSIGRYGSWTYCSIEDNIIEAKKLCSILNTI